MSENPERPWIASMRKIIHDEAAAPPIAKLLGFKVVEVSEGVAKFEMEAGPQHYNPMGTLHGGVLCDLGDAAMGFAMASTLLEGESFTTVELKINYFKPVWKGLLRATGRMVKRSRSLGYLECDIVDAKESLVCRLGSTCMVLRGEAATGR